jgi:hypothetical protein
MSGAIAMGTNKITGLGTPTANADAATKVYVDTAISNLVAAAPGALDTLDELAAALGDDANFATTVTNSIATKLALAGGTMSGAIAMGTNKITGLGDPTLAQDAATKTYVDTADALKLNLAGGTMSGAIAMGTSKITGLGNPTANQDAATKTYVDTADALKLNLSGGTMSGAIAMGTSKITGLGTPTDNADATTKLYVDGILGSATAAAASASAAATSASNAATSASNASTSASNASSSASAASTSATNAANSYDAFDDRYLGSKSSAPSVDNDGNALLTGALYWNSTSNELYLWTGSAWTRSALAGSDYVAKTGDTMTGALTTTGLTVSGLTASTALALDASKNVVSVTNTGSGNNVLATSPTLVTPALGTPSALVGTNITGTAANFNINGTVGATTPSTGNFTTLTENSIAAVTQSDIGSAPNEIPLNQYLGSLAYQNGDAYYNTGMTVGFRNRIINGAMMIDQRNAGAAITTSTGFPVDRFNYSFGGGAFTAQRISDAPSGFVNSLRISCTSTSTADVGFETKFEGNNLFDIGFGSANASLMTLSFWVKSNLAGQFSAFLYRPDANRSCVLGYTINVANTWEYKTILIPADSTGAITATNGEGLRLDFFLALSSATGSPSVWKSLDSQRGITGQVNLGSSTSNTWQITGVQLEKGNIATSFDVRPYTTELQLCQRYYTKFITDGDIYTFWGSGGVNSTTNAIICGQFPTKMRSSPTISVSNARIYDCFSSYATTTIGTNRSSTTSLSAEFTISSATVGRPCFVGADNNNAGYLDASAEL